MRNRCVCGVANNSSVFSETREADCVRSRLSDFLFDLWGNGEFVDVWKQSWRVRMRMGSGISWRLMSLILLWFARLSSWCFGAER